MRPIPFIYVTDMERSLEWYRTVLGSARVLTTSPYWSELEVDGGVLALHVTERIQPGGAASVSFVADEALEGLIGRLARASISPVRGVEDEPFGRSIVLEDPDGFRFQVNEYAR